MRIILALLALTLAGCGNSSPTAPTKPLPATVGGIFLVPSSLEVPIGGGSVDIVIATATTPGGGVIAPNVDLDLTATSGALSATHVRTNSEGRASVTWSGEQTATVRAVAGELFATSVIRVAEPAPTPEPEPTPVPNPTPNPSPTPSPAPVPRKILVSVGVSGPLVPNEPADTYPAGVTLDFTGAVTSNGAALPTSLSWGWDFDGDGTIDAITPGENDETGTRMLGFTTHVYAPGVYHPAVTALPLGGDPVKSSAITITVK